MSLQREELSQTFPDILLRVSFLRQRLKRVVQPTNGRNRCQSDIKELKCQMNSVVRMYSPGIKEKMHGS